MPRTGGELRVRPARADDASALARFRCSTGPWFEEEVAHHIRVDALARALDADAAYRLLLFEQRDRLWAVGAHQPEELDLDSGDELLATRLVVFAVDVNFQGVRLPDGSTYAQAALDSLIADAIAYRGQARSRRSSLARTFAACASAVAAGFCSRRARTGTTSE